MSDLRYPIGRFERPDSVTDAARIAAIEQIEAAPAALRTAIKGLTEDQLDTPYRPDGWTVRQVIHHVADSHMNSNIRFRLALTEDEPPIKGYDEKAWSQLEDALQAPVEPSLDLLDSLHYRWVRLLRSLTPEQWSRSFRHSEIGLIRLDVNALMYAWHGRHHLAHITRLRDRMGW